MESTGWRPGVAAMLRRAAWHNLVHLLLATLGAIMLGVAYLRIVDHSVTLWLSLP